MPIRALSHRLLQTPVGLAEAPDVFEAAGIMPREVIQLIVDGEDDERRSALAGLSPSVLDPGTKCRRELAIRRFLPYVQDPSGLWAALAGTLWHRVLRSGAGEAGKYRYEVPLPGPEHEGQPGVRRNEGGWYEYELWPGVWVSGVLDRVSKDWTEIADFKTSRFSKTDYGMKDDWVIQLNGYRFLVESLTGVEVQKMGVWRIYEGSYEPDRTFRYFAFEKSDDARVRHFLPRELYDARVRDFATTLAAYLEACTRVKDDVLALETELKKIPMDGQVKNMFNGKKCFQYCSCREECFRLAGQGLKF